MSAVTAPPPPDSSTMHASPPASWLFAPVSIATLVYFRIGLGLILLWESYRFLSSGWVQSLFLDPPLRFTYFGFGWVPMLPDPWLTGVFYALGGLGICVAAGLLYRITMPLLFLTFSYIFLLDQSNYLNHFYLVVIICGLMCLLPAYRAFSLDAKLFPAIRSQTMPRWVRELLRFQIGVAYFFGGIAKLNPDWLSGIPMQLMLMANDDFPLVRPFFGEVWVALLFAYGGLLLDLLIVPALWWKPTRIPALLVAASFHLMNDMLFRIGIFPWFMLAATVILWPPFPLRPLALLRIYGSLIVIRQILGILEITDEAVPMENAVVAGLSAAALSLFLFRRSRLIGLIGFIAIQVVGALLFDVAVPGILFEPQWAGLALLLVSAIAAAVLLFPPRALRDLSVSQEQMPQPLKDRSPARQGRWGQTVVLTGLVLLMTWQCLMPLRHWLYPGDVSWTEEGHKYAWHMKLRVKVADYAHFFIVGEDGRTLADVPIFTPGTDFRYDRRGGAGNKADREAAFEQWIDDFIARTQLTPRQASTMSTRPELIRQYAHQLAERFEEEFAAPVGVTANIAVSLNAREPQLLVSPDADLSQKNATWAPADWILPNEALRPEIRRWD
ncbi:HTTM domain-containing protein [Stratiformator vulcanicus]|uniref:Vitamin K-dependent gamma-carboxylase n=1 Tax=Stratiformator vulcanicus TaxID=2527980 RepID=A0A517R6W1_9PLAN|nr:HTTM domain-containing protein [Stratiformator vulcanicus]QDT39636.1 Vitamin K-dependent gamma-carboxylase [Stratiformator vulcanicus]